MKTGKAIVIDEKDNVAIALTDVDKNDAFQVKIGERSTKVQVQEKIQFGHKFAMRRISKGENVMKYGEVIGRATQDIGKGQHVHVHNVESLRAQ